MGDGVRASPSCLPQSPSTVHAREASLLTAGAPKPIGRAGPHRGHSAVRGPGPPQRTGRRWGRGGRLTRSLQPHGMPGSKGPPVPPTRPRWRAARRRDTATELRAPTSQSRAKFNHRTIP